jgi:aspartyl-tRNA(Asn)/glutamyl-tRNA(Gln) amidotransferase subunit A
MRVAQVIVICTEMAQAMSASHALHRREHGQDVRVNVRIARILATLDYIHSQRVRSRVLVNFQRVFADVDAIMTPATACVAPIIPVAPHGIGVSDLSTATKLMRFATPANLADLPAISLNGWSVTQSGIPKVKFP